METTVLNVHYVIHIIGFHATLMRPDWQRSTLAVLLCHKPKSCADESHYVVSYNWASITHLIPSTVRSTVVWLCGCYVKFFLLTASELLLCKVYPNSCDSIIDLAPPGEPPHHLQLALRLPSLCGCYIKCFLLTNSLELLLSTLNTKSFCSVSVPEAIV